MITQLSSYRMSPERISELSHDENPQAICADALSEEAAYRAFQRELQSGWVVEARWTESCLPYRAPALVRVKNRKSVRVELLESAGSFEAGAVVTVPLKTPAKDTAWRRERGVFPQGR